MKCANVDLIAMTAKNSLLDGSDVQFRQLIEVLNKHRLAYVSHFSRLYMSVDSADLESSYMETLWRLTLEYEPAKGEFVRLLNAALRFRALDLARSSVPYSQHNTSYEAIVDEQPGLIAPQENRDTDVSIDDMLDYLEEHGITDPDAQAAAISIALNDAALGDVVDISDGAFRNKQQVWRKVRVA